MARIKILLLLFIQCRLLTQPIFGRAHVEAVQHAGEADVYRCLLNARSFDFQEAVDVLRKNFPERQSMIVEGKSGAYSQQGNILDGGQHCTWVDSKYK